MGERKSRRSQETDPEYRNRRPDGKTNPVRRGRVESKNLPLIPPSSYRPSGPVDLPLDAADRSQLAHEERQSEKDKKSN